MRDWSYQLAAVIAIGLLTASEAEAQRVCAAPGGGGGGGTAAGGAGARGAVGGGGIAALAGGGTIASSAAAPGSTPFLIQEFLVLQQSRAQNLLNQTQGRRMNMSVRSIAPSNRAIAVRPSKARPARKDKISLRRRREIAMELNRQRAEESQQEESAEPDEDEPVTVANDPEAIPEIFRQ